ncbi:GNAT family N-acetyltransferase [Maribellus sediminis]|uniref:GNAT family N-acetyltransferase n=1 Tax=Maribellus sediminis TaxID=2696285 RepID=UPI001431BE78|nr:GNAT family N-acetyltransferase [Maribellus sediminis]
MEIVIRKATDDDIPAIFGLIQELAIYENGLDKVKNSVDQMYAEKDFFNCYVAEDNGEIIGMSLYYFVYYTWVGKALYLDDLFVKEAYRGKKIGSKLMQKMMDVAREEKCHRLRLQVLNWNSPAIEFYKKSGFNIDEDWHNCDFIDL